MEQLKEEITDYWTKRAEGFSALRIKEWNSALHERWLSEICRFLPADSPLHILDVGTGTGFFAFLLSSQGHHVTGIDLTPDMIEQAKRTGRTLGLEAAFYVMDAEQPQFAPASFDVIITRNLTWSLPHLADAYRAWHTLLKEGGLLLNFDADYCREKEDRCIPACNAHADLSRETMQAYDHLKDELRGSSAPRPDWDRELLQKAGFRDVQIDTDVWKRIYQEHDEFFNPTPIFLISARA